jgi:molybdopterin converting factor small subunit
MTIHVKVGGQLRTTLGQEAIVVQTGGNRAMTLGGVLAAIAEQHAHARELLFKADGSIAGGLLVLLDDTAAVPDHKVALADGATITLLSAISGG